MGDDHSGGQPGGPASKALERFRSEIGTDEKATWVPYTGPEGGEGWQNLDTGDIEYTDDPPGPTPDPDDIPDEDLEQLADEAGVEGADAEEIRDALKEELGEREADDGDGDGDGDRRDTEEFVDSLEAGDTIEYPDGDTAEVVGQTDAGVEVDAGGNTYQIGPDDRAAEDVEVVDDGGDDDNAGGDSGLRGLDNPDDKPAPDDYNTWGEGYDASDLENTSPNGFAESENVIGGIVGSDAMQSFSDDVAERAEEQGVDIDSPLDLVNSSGMDQDIIDDAAEDVFEEYRDAYTGKGGGESGGDNDDGDSGNGGGGIELADPDDGPAAEGEYGDRRPGASETADEVGSAVALAGGVTEETHDRVVNTLDAMDDPSDQDVANVLDEAGVYDDIAGEVYGDILADNGIDLPEPDTGGGGSGGDGGDDGGDGGETEPGDDYDPLVDMDDEDAIKEQIDNIMAGSDPQTVDEIAFQLSRADQPTESDVAEAAELAGFRGPDKDRTVDQLTAELGLPYDDALDQNAEPADPVDGQVSKARARYERLRARQREQNAGAAGVSEKAGAGLGPSARFKLLVSVKNWVPYEGPMGGEGWQNIDSGEVSYDDEPPGAAPDPDKIPDEDLEAFAEENGIDAEPEELRDTLREELADRGAPGSGGGDFGADDTQDPTDLLEDNLPTGGGMDMSPLRSTDDAAQEAADIHNDFVLDEIDKDEYEERAREWAEEHGMADDAGSGSDTAEVGSHHLVTNPMTGDRMDAEVTGEPTVPRGSESGEEQYPVEFENGDSGYVPRDEVEPQEPDTEDVNAVADAVMDEVLGNEGLIDYGTISEVASSDLTDVEATPELVDEVAEVFDVEQNAETQDPVEGQVEKARSFIESRRGD